MKARPETDEEYRARVLEAVDPGSFNRNAAETSTGEALDQIGASYDVHRGNVEDHTAKVIGLPTGPTDAERAEQYRQALRPVLEEACRLLALARSEGLQINWNLAPDQYGRYVIQALDVLKVL